MKWNHTCLINGVDLKKKKVRLTVLQKWEENPVRSFSTCPKLRCSLSCFTRNSGLKGRGQFPCTGPTMSKWNRLSTKGNKGEWARPEVRLPDLCPLQMKCGSSSNRRCEERGPSRWWRSKTWRSPSSPQIHQKYIYVWNNSYRTPTKHWQKNSDFPKAMWLTGSWCSGRLSGLSLWGGRAKFRTSVHQRPPGPT